MYDQLTKFYPACEEYKLYHAQSLYKAGLYDEAMKACQSFETPQYQEQVLQLQIAIQYELEEIQHAKSLASGLASDSPENIITQGCILFKEEKYEDAR